MTYVCPVCGYSRLEEPPANFTICDSCGTEFELDDEVRTHDQLRRLWLQNGAQWFNPAVAAPRGWREYRIQQLVEFTLYGSDDSQSPPLRVTHRQLASVALLED